MDTHLDDIPWATLHHAYGTAEDTPTHLRAMCDPDDDVFEQAMEALWASICHQGSIYEASYYVIPFLVEILDEAPESRRERLLMFLAELACHDAYAYRTREVFTHRDFRDVGKFDQEANALSNVRYTYQDLINEGNQFFDAHWTQMTHVQVGESLPHILGLRPQLPPSTRSVMWYLFSAFTERRDQFMTALLQTLGDSAISALETMAALLCLGDVANAHEMPVPESMRELLSHPESGIRLSAAISLLRSQSYPLPLMARWLIADALVHPTDYDSLLIETPWFYRGSLHHTLLTDLGHARPIEAIPIVLMALEQGAPVWFPPDAIRVAETLLDLVFFGIVDSGRYWDLAVLTPYEAQQVPPEHDHEPLEHLVFQLQHDRSSKLLHHFSTIYGTTQGVNADYNTFEAQRLSKDRERRGFTAQQYDLLRFLLRYEPLWQMPTNLFAIYDLPTSREALRVFCDTQPR